MKKASITFWALMFSGIILNAKTLEIREYTIIGKDPIPTQVLDAAHALPFGMVFDAFLSLPVPPPMGKLYSGISNRCSIP